MENIEDNSIFEFNVDEESKSQLGGIAQWAKLNAIVGFIALGVTVISTVISFSKLGGVLGGGAVAGSGLGVLISLAISLLLNITLITAATFIKKAVENTDQGSFEMGISKLAGYFKITGILTIIVLVIVILAVLIGVIAGAAQTGF